MRVLESWVLSYLLNSLWQVPLLFAAGWIAARALRSAGAAMEHRLWVAVLALESLIPALSSMRWDWLGRLLAWREVGPGASAAHVAVAMGTGTVAAGLRVPSAALASIAIVYGVTTAYFVARFAWHWHKLRVLQHEAVAVRLEGDAADSLNLCAQRLAVGEVVVATSRRIFGPVTIGFRRKLVVFPTGMLADLSEVELQTAMAHELAHVQRNDYAKNLLYEILLLPLMYHPLAWLTRERVTESREIVCDQIAAETNGRAQYARSLLRLASLLVSGAAIRTPHAIGIFDTKTLERRIMRLTKEQFQMRGARRMAAIFICVAFGIAACGTALAMGMHVDPGAAGYHATSSPRTISVAPGVIAGNRISGDNPKYPEKAKKDKVQGTVVLKALIDTNGDIKDLKVVSGPKELRESARRAVQTWKYKPYLLNGNPVQVKTTISVTYLLAR